MHLDRIGAEGRLQRDPGKPLGDGALRAGRVAAGVLDRDRVSMAQHRNTAPATRMFSRTTVAAALTPQVSANAGREPVDVAAAGELLQPLGAQVDHEQLGVAAEQGLTKRWPLARLEYERK